MKVLTKDLICLARALDRHTISIASTMIGGGFVCSAFGAGFAGSLVGFFATGLLFTAWHAYDDRRFIHPIEEEDEP